MEYSRSACHCKEINLFINGTIGSQLSKTRGGEQPCAQGGGALEKRWLSDQNKCFINHPLSEYSSKQENIKAAKEEKGVDSWKGD